VFSVTHNGHVHDFEIEDPKFAEKHYPQFPGVHDPAKAIQLEQPNETLLCVSLAGRFHGHHYKIAAGIFEPDSFKEKSK
jgi:hypothetical protein